MAPKQSQFIRTRALRLDQNPDHPVYQFSLTGEQILQIADISRVSREDGGRVIGYQRPEVKKHVADIVSYLDGEKTPLFINSIILAISSRVNFVQSRGPKVGEQSVPGTLEIPVAAEGQPKPAWIVDGQQRTLALSKSTRKNLTVPINAFVSDDVEQQRDQFLRVNNSRPLPRGLVDELLPEVTTPLPIRLSARQLPSMMCDMLNTDPRSPFFGMIKRSSTSKADRRKTFVTDNSVIRMIQDSVSSTSGCLFAYRNLATNQTDVDGVRAVLFTFWNAVKEVFPDAWGKPPTKSRLMGGTGIRAMGRLMDRVMASINPRLPDAQEWVVEQLTPLVSECAWTDGHWEALGGLSWDELQNVPKHVRVLSNHLVRLYLQQGVPVLA